MSKIDKSKLTAEQKIVYIDVKYILNLSKAGKGAQDFLAKTFNKYSILLSSFTAKTS